MAISIGTNFKVNRRSPLDEKQVVDTNAELANIEAAYKGLVVHVADNDAKTYVCLNEDVSGSVPGGVPAPAVWKELGAGGGSSTTVTLEDESSAPTGVANKVILYSEDELSAESMPDHLYLFDEGSSDTAALDSGREGTGNTGLKTGANFTGGGLGEHGNSAIFGAANTTNIRVGGISAPYHMTGTGPSGEATRADFELHFKFDVSSSALNRLHTLISTDPSNHQTNVEGFYSVLLNASSSSGGASIIFEYYGDYTNKLETIEWVIPGTLRTNSAYQLNISFFEDDRGYDTTTISPASGKFRCYLDVESMKMVVLEDKNTADALSIAGSFEMLGKNSSAIHPVYLGQYLNGSAAAGNPTALFHFASNYTNAVSSGPTMASGGSNGATNNTAHSTFDAAFGTQARIENSTSSSAEAHLEIDLSSSNPFSGTGAFTFECFLDVGSLTANWGQTLFSMPGPASGGSAGSLTFIVTPWSYVSLKQWQAGYAMVETKFKATGADGMDWQGSVGTMKHFVLQREAESGGNAIWHLGFDGVWIALYNGSRTIQYEDLASTSLFIGKDSLVGATSQPMKAAWVDDVRISPAAVYSPPAGATYTTGTYTAPTAPFELALDPSARFFTGKMHEFAVWNHRCLHNTSDKFGRSLYPIRSTPLSVASVVDSENTSSPILTTSNLGMLLPKAVEGLADGTAWNDKGIVKIAPLTGDLDSVSSPVVDGVLSLPTGTTPTATAGVVKLYSKNVTGGDDADILLHMNNSLADSGDVGATVTAPGSSNSLSFDSSTKKFGSYSTFYNPASGADGFCIIPYSSQLKFDGDWTIELWVKFGANSHTQYWSDIIGIDRSVNGSTWNSGFRLAYWGIDNGANNSNKGKFYLAKSKGSSHGYAIFDTDFNTGNAEYKTEKWNHIAICKDSTGARFYHNGVKQTHYYDSSFLSGTAVTNSNEDPMILGRTHDHTQDEDDAQLTSSNSLTAFNGWIDEFKLLKGTAQYTDDFDVPTSQYSTADTVTHLFAIDSEGNETKLT